MTDVLQPFLLYCQWLESLYTQWKNFWLVELTREKKDEHTLW